MSIGLPDVSPLLGPIRNLTGVNLILGVIVSKRMELPEQEGVKTLLEVPRIFFVDHHSTHNEHRTTAVCSGFVNEAQVQQFC